MVGLLMPKKAESKEAQASRKTASVQVDADISRMIAVVASHQRKSQAELISLVLRKFIVPLYAKVSVEIQQEMKSAEERRLE